jgi:hypothetical protein
MVLVRTNICQSRVHVATGALVSPSAAFPARTARWLARFHLQPDVGSRQLRETRLEYAWNELAGVPTSEMTAARRAATSVVLKRPVASPYD